MNTDMKTFTQWLAERGVRTALGPYPPLYGGVGQYPPLYFAPISAGHLNAFANTHGDVHKDLLSDPIKREFEKNKKRKKQRQAEEKKL
jgi:hypothetical protein